MGVAVSKPLHILGREEHSLVLSSILLLTIQCAGRSVFIHRASSWGLGTFFRWELIDLAPSLWCWWLEWRMSSDWWLGDWRGGDTSVNPPASVPEVDVPYIDAPEGQRLVCMAVVSRAVWGIRSLQKKGVSLQMPSGAWAGGSVKGYGINGRLSAVASEVLDSGSCR